MHILTIGDHKILPSLHLATWRWSALWQHIYAWSPSLAKAASALTSRLVAKWYLRPGRLRNQIALILFSSNSAEGWANQRRVIIVAESWTVSSPLLLSELQGSSTLFILIYLSQFMSNHWYDNNEPNVINVFSSIFCDNSRTTPSQKIMENVSKQPALAVVIKWLRSKWVSFGSISS